nr:hypothetical protein [Streptomyces sp. QL37]PPQ57486.1 hypothetical protein C5F59_12880 [Streptomyces sp. QL37]
MAPSTAAAAGSRTRTRTADRAASLRRRTATLLTTGRSTSVWSFHAHSSETANAPRTTAAATGVDRLLSAPSRRCPYTRTRPCTMEKPKETSPSQIGRRPADGAPRSWAFRSAWVTAATSRASGITGRATRLYRYGAWQASQ